MSGVSLEVQLGIIEAEIAQQPECVQEFYCYLIEERGQQPKMAHMLALQRAPMMRASDKRFNQSYRRDMMRRDSRPHMDIVNVAKRAGVNTSGKYYVGGLGRVTDPTAWVSTVDDIKTVCKAKNLTAEGIHQGVSVDRAPRAPLAPDLVDEEVSRRIEASPKLQERFWKDRDKVLKEERGIVREKHSYSP